MEIRNVGIIGSGIMGCQIAELFLKYNFNVTLYARNYNSLKNCLSRFRQKELAAKLITTTNFEDLKNNDLLIESVKENAEIKQEIFEKLDKIVLGNAIMASNTSSIPLSTIAKNCKNKQNILGIHFFNPVSHIKLVEVAKPFFVSEGTFNAAIELIKKLDKEPVVVKDTPGFICNRILFAMLNEAANVLHEGISKKDEIDKAMVLGALHPAGPLKIIDIVGVDVTVDILQNLQNELKDNKFAPSPVLLQMLKENKLGRKTKKGFYEY